MKNQTSTVLLALLSVFMLHASAQDKKLPLNELNYSKPRLFNDIPDKTPLRMASLEALLDLPVGASVNAVVADNFSLLGTIVSKSKPTDTNVKSIIIKSTNHQGAVFTFTRVKTADGRFSFIGRMLNTAGGDALEITKEGDTYVMRKKGINEVVTE